MVIIAGLGNPGSKYEGTRHNAGFDVIDALIDKYHIPSSGLDMKGMYGKGVICGQKVILLKPMTYMNLSGECIQPFVHYYKCDPETELILVYDDIDLEPGNIRVRKKGSAGSHNGMKSVIGRLGTENFPRVRVGVGSKPAGWDLADFVLSRYGKEDRSKVDAAIGQAVEAIEMILQDDLDGAMNRFNRKPKKPKQKKTAEGAGGEGRIQAGDGQKADPAVGGEVGRGPELRQAAEPAGNGSPEPQNAGQKKDIQETAEDRLEDQTGIRKESFSDLGKQECADASGQTGTEGRKNSISADIARMQKQREEEKAEQSMNPLKNVLYKLLQK